MRWLLVEDNNSRNKVKREEEYFLSELIGLKVRREGKKIGSLSDFILVETGKIPEVTHLCHHKVVWISLTAYTNE